MQGCVRTVDIDNIGDETHFSFFEMMGNWSIGDYFKKEKVAWTFELLTEVFGLDKNKICSTVFAGSKNAPKDDETAKLLEATYHEHGKWINLPDLDRLRKEMQLEQTKSTKE